MAKKFLWFIVSAVLITQLQAAEVLIYGKVTDKVTGKVIDGVEVKVETVKLPTQVLITTFTDHTGTYQLSISTGKYSLSFSHKVYQPEKLQVAFWRPKKKKLDIKLSPVEVYDLTELVVRAEKPETLPSKQVMKKEEIKETSTDLFSSVSETLKTLPGILSYGDFSGMLFIRGAYPLESIYLLDRVFVAFPYRWGGGLDIFNTRLVDKIELYTGGFPAEVGNCIGGVIDIKYREGNNKKFSSEMDFSPATMEVLFEGPIKKPNITGIFTAKRTHYDLLMNLFGTGNVFPYFDELYGKLNWSLGDKHKFYLFNLYTDEGMKLKMTEEEAKQQGYYEKFEFDYFYYKNILAFNWENKISDKLNNELTVANTIDKGDYEFYSPTIPWDYKLRSMDYSLRNDLTYKITPEHKLRTGVYGYCSTELTSIFSMKIKIIEEEDGKLKEKWKTIESVFRAKPSYLGVYLWDKWQLFSPLTLDLGLRYEQFSLTPKNAFTPRVSLSYALDELTTLKTAIGQYSNFDIEVWKYDKKDGNPNLKPQCSLEYLVGAERKLTEKLRTRIEVYRRNLTDLVVKDNTFNYSNKGTGVAEGVELFLEKKSDEHTKLDGWISYTYSVSQRSIGDGISYGYGSGQYDYERGYGKPDPNKLYFTDGDQTHNLSVVANYKLGRGWKVSSDWRYNSGKPYTPIARVEEYTNPATGEKLYMPVMGEHNSGRLPYYSRVDAKVSKLHKFRWGDLTWYVQILNLFNDNNIYGYYYSKDYKEKFEFKMFGFMFFGGCEIKF